MPNQRLRLITLFSSAVLALAGALPVFAQPPVQPQIPDHPNAPVCPGPAEEGTARCHARVVLESHGGPPAAAQTPAGYGPADLQAAYALSPSGGSGVTVAVVDAYDNPTAENDLGVYRSQFGLSACTTANGCFKKVNQTGGTRYPRGNSGWALESALDIQMVSAICPNCNILLVEANSNSLANLLAAEDYARSHATVVSNSWGASEFSSEGSYDSHFTGSGVRFTASSGDSGYGVIWPAASPNVTAVGGTSLTRDSSSRGWSETVWSGAGSGCSAFESQPGFQSSITRLTAVCANRAVADVAFDANPNTGVAVYDSYGYQGRKGWFVVGGTSVGAPAIAAAYALANNGGTTSGTYSNTSSLNDVTSGSNGSCGNLLCNGATGWDGPTGNGTPKGTGAF